MQRGAGDLASLTQEELKERAALYLKRVAEVSSSATKTAVLSFSALAVIWFSQIHLQYRQLLDDVYPKFTPSAYYNIKNQREELKDTKDKLKDEMQKIGVPDRRDAAQQEPTSESTVEVKPEAAERTKNLQRNFLEKNRALRLKKSDLESRVTSISFEVFGLKLPVPPLWASVVWNTLLLGLLLYLARARSLVWRLCANALFAFKRLTTPPAVMDEIAGSGPIWIAPSPSLPGTVNSPSVNDLRAAFGWNRLQTLPSIGATTGFLLLSVLQLTVTSEGFAMIRAARAFTEGIMSSQELGKPVTGAPASSVLSQRVSQLAVIVQTDEETKSQTPSYVLKQQLMQLVITPTESSLISVLLCLMLSGMALLVTWWFRPWSVPSLWTERTAVPRLLVISVLVFLLVISLILFLGWFVPELGWYVGEKISEILPGIIRFIGASVVSFCLIELVLVAFTRQADAPTG
jgi:hypothetical protein